MKLRLLLARIVCLLKGHRYGELERHKPGFVQIGAGCLRCGHGARRREYRGQHPLPRNRARIHVDS